MSKSTVSGSKWAQSYRLFTKGTYGYSAVMDLSQVLKLINPYQFNWEIKQKQGSPKCSVSLRNFKNKVFELKEKPKYIDFGLVEKYFNLLTAEFDKTHEVLGSIISHYIGARMMKMIMEDIKSDKYTQSDQNFENDVMPDSVFSDTFNFTSLIGELENSIEAYDKGPSMYRTPKVSTFVTRITFWKFVKVVHQSTFY